MSSAASGPRGPQPSLTAVKPCRGAADALAHDRRVVGHQHRGVGANPVARGADQLADRLPSALPMMSQSAMSMPLIACSAIPRRPM